MYHPHLVGAPRRLEAQFHGDLAPQVVAGHPGVAAQLEDDLEQPVQVDVLVGDVGRAVDGLAAVLHVLVQLGHQVVLK